MAITTTGSLGKNKPRRCDSCNEPSERLFGGEMGKLLCERCAPAKVIIGRTLPSED